MKSPLTFLLLAATLLHPSDSGDLGNLPSIGSLIRNLPSLPEIFNILSKFKTSVDIRLRPHVAIDVIK